MSIPGDCMACKHVAKGRFDEPCSSCSLLNEYASFEPSDATMNAVIHKAIKKRCNPDGTIIRYRAYLYYVSLNENRVVRQLIFK